MLHVTYICLNYGAGNQAIFLMYLGTKSNYLKLPLCPNEKIKTHNSMYMVVLVVFSFKNTWIYLFGPSDSAMDFFSYPDLNLINRSNARAILL